MEGPLTTPLMLISTLLTTTQLTPTNHQNPVSLIIQRLPGSNLMASLTMTASLFGGANVSSARRYIPIVAKASASSSSSKGEEVKLSTNQKNEESRSANGRRDVIFAAAAAAACSIAGVALAKEYPKRGTKEAKKFYGPICVSMPTASVCRN